MTEIETWAYIDNDGNVVLFAAKPHTNPGEEHLKKVYMPEWPFTTEEEELPSIIGTIKGYWTIPASHKIAKYVREYGVEVTK